MAFDSGWSLAGSDRARAAGAQATRVAGQPQADTGAGPASASAPTARAASRPRSARDIGPSSGSPSEPRQPHGPCRQVAASPMCCVRRDARGEPVKPTGNAVVRRPFGEIDRSEVLRDALRAPPGRSDILPWAAIGLG